MRLGRPGTGFWNSTTTSFTISATDSSTSPFPTTCCSSFDEFSVSFSNDVEAVAPF